MDDLDVVDSRAGRHERLGRAGHERRRVTLPTGRALLRLEERAAGGERDAAALVAGAAQTLVAAGARIDYVEIVHPTRLTRVARAETGSRMLVAAFVGATRLIDNVALP